MVCKKTLLVEKLWYAKKLLYVQLMLTGCENKRVAARIVKLNKGRKK